MAPSGTAGAPAVKSAPKKVVSADATRPPSKRIQRASNPSYLGVIIALIVGALLLGAIWMWKYGPLRHHASPPPEYAPEPSLTLSPAELEQLKTQNSSTRKKPPVYGTYVGSHVSFIIHVNVTLTIEPQNVWYDSTGKVEGKASLQITVSFPSINKTVDNISFTIENDNTITPKGTQWEQIKQLVKKLPGKPMLKYEPNQDTVIFQGSAPVLGAVTFYLKR